ncbi:hypothetical protein AeRB84_000607 [Aphanomyces euteiches]|nr:hypothetical protein AeRB84_000607 [Aphanomyces euteiches]
MTLARVCQVDCRLSKSMRLGHFKIDMVSNNPTRTRQRNLKNCIVPGCPNQVYARQDAIYALERMGFALPMALQSADATNQDAITQHGGGRRCTTHGCTSHARYKGKCKRHARSDTPVDMMALWGAPGDSNHELSNSDDSMDDAAASIPSPSSRDACGESNGEHAASPLEMMMEVCELLLSP